MLQTVLETRCLSSLTKVFADEDLADRAYTKASALRKETYSFQVAYKSNRLLKHVRVSVDSGGLDSVSIRNVGLAPSELPCYHDHDDYVLRAAPGLYPDPLYPIDAGVGITAFPNQWRAVWITVDIGEHAIADLYRLEVLFHTETGELLSKEEFELEVIPVRLQDQKLIHTQWFHTDCIATWYGVEAFSERHWELIGRYLRNAAAHGVNMILTPIFTPPLDTAVGKERPTMQLVDVRKMGDRYSFEFGKLGRWIDLCLKQGIQYFEMAHLFTQWGAKHAPKIMALEDGQTKRLFGWDTDALGADYQLFLSQFLPALIAYCEERQLHGRIYFHISDEPHLEHLEHYEQVSRFVRSLIKEYPAIDALSNFEFYQSGAVPHPIPSNDVVHVFIENQVQGLWTYYCCGQYKEGVSNRFFDMPSARNRVLGSQLYKYNMEGFLQWGYNFWYAARSERVLDPYTNTDGLYSFPSGDTFAVYPGENGPIDSIRHEVFREALQDLRALQTLEGLAGKNKVLELLEQDVDTPITFKQYPRSLTWLLSMRERVNQFIKSMG